LDSACLALRKPGIAEQTFPCPSTQREAIDDNTAVCSSTGFSAAPKRSLTFVSLARMSRNVSGLKSLRFTR
jgi:hypothetical protein